MKNHIKKYWLVLSLGGFLILGALTMNFFISKLYQAGTTFSSVSGLYMRRNIPTYAQEAGGIVIGKVATVSASYLHKDRGFTSQQDVIVDVEEVIKGDRNMKSLKVLLEGTQMVSVQEGKEPIFTSDDESQVIFKPGEKVLLFLGVTNWGDYVPFAGPYGKYLIDENNNVQSIGEFSMSLEKLKSQINEGLKLPVRPRDPLVPISVEH